MLMCLERGESGILYGPEIITLGQCHSTGVLPSAGLRCGTPPMMHPSMNRIAGLELKIVAICLAVLGDTALRSR